MSRLPVVGSDDGTWGTILNDFLSVEHNSDGTQKTLDITKGGTGAVDAATARTNLGLGSAALKDVASTGNASTLQVVKGDDTRLTDARTPTAHASTHAPGGSDALTYSLAGVLASRPTAASSNSGLMYFATDDNGGTMYRSDGSSWTKIAASVTQSGGAELGYSEITSNFSQVATANTFYDVTGLSSTVTIGTRPVLITAFFPVMLHSVTFGDITVAIYEDGTLVSAATATEPTANRAFIGISNSRRAPSAGSHTYAIKVKTTIAGTITLQAASNFPAYVRVVEG